MPFTVMLIHGTFARDARWTLEKSELCAHLKREFGDDIRFARFAWDPPNLHSARVEGAPVCCTGPTLKGGTSRKKKAPIL